MERVRLREPARTTMIQYGDSLIAAPRHIAGRNCQQADTGTDLTLFLLRVLLRRLVIWHLLILGVGIPFAFAGARATIAGLSLTSIFMLATPFWLAAKGRVTAAAWMFVAAGTIISTALVLFSQGVRGPDGILQLAIVIAAAALLGRRAAWGVSAVCLTADLGMAWFEWTGGRLPALFASSPLRAWFDLVTAFALSSPPISIALDRLACLLDQLQTQVRERRKAAEQIFCQAQILAQSTDPLIAADNNRIVTFWNAAAGRLIGWQAHEAIGKSLDELVRIAPGGFNPETLQAELARAGRWTGEITWQTRHGGTLVVDAAIVTLRNSAGEGVGIVGGFREVSERLRVLENIAKNYELEERSLHSQKMESLGRLATAVAHDFNNLLTVIDGYCDVLLRQLEPTAKTREPLQQIRGAVENATELSRQLLAFSRKQTASPRPLDLNRTILDTEMIMRRLLGEDIELLLRLDPSSPTVLADPGRVRQVLMNLVVNSRDALPRGGQVIVATTYLDSPISGPRGASGSPEVAHVVLSVEDTGIGMDQITQQHLFEPFFTTKEEGEGTGLGLAIVYGIVNQAGGWIEVDSRVGKGTRFSIYLPAIRAFPIPGSRGDTSAP